MGPNWESVVDKCCRGHSQPLLLLYVSSNLTPISTADALERAVIINRDQRMHRADAGRRPSTSVMQRPESARRRDSTSDHLFSLGPGYAGNQYRTAVEAVQNDETDQFRQPSYLVAVGSHDEGRDNAVAKHSKTSNHPRTGSCSNSVNSLSCMPPAYKHNGHDEYRYIDATLPRAHRHNPPLSHTAHVNNGHTLESQRCSSEDRAQDFGTYRNGQQQYERQKSDICNGNERKTTPTSIVSCSVSPWIDGCDGYDESKNYIDSKTVEKILQSRTRKTVSHAGSTRGADSVSSNGSTCSLNSGGSWSSSSIIIDTKPGVIGCHPPRTDNNNFASSKIQTPGNFNNSSAQTALVGDRSSSSSTSSGLSNGSSSLESNQDSGYRSGDQDGTASTCSSLSLESTTSAVGSDASRLIVHMPGIGRVPILLGDKPDYWEASRMNSGNVQRVHQGVATDFVDGRVGSTIQSGRRKDTKGFSRSNSAGIITKINLFDFRK